MLNLCNVSELVCLILRYRLDGILAACWHDAGFICFRSRMTGSRRGMLVLSFCKLSLFYLVSIEQGR